ncbi:MAG: hypothetical protein E7206_10410 [Clostridium beijerinckii]|nr:hypothetical protein [Clostridium beijerinckii]
MTGKTHDQLMRATRGYIKLLDASAKMQTSNFFVESAYLDVYQSEKPCYLLTKKGCDMVDNKIKYKLKAFKILGLGKQE